MSQPISLPTSEDAVFSIDDMDPAVDPGADFYRFVNGGWKDANPVPPEYSRWAAFEEIRHGNELLIRRLLDEAAEHPGPEGTPRSWAGAYYRSGMDVGVIESAGLEPIGDYLHTIDAIEDLADLRSVAAAMLPFGVALPIGIYVAPDFEDSKNNLLYLGQSGLGLPERDYYFRDDDQSVQLRSQYVDHIAAMLELAGHSDPSGSASAILELETSLAESAYTNAQKRDMDLVLNRHTSSDIAGLMPQFDLGHMVGQAGAPEQRAFNVENPEFFAAADERLASADPAILRAYATWHLLSTAASSLPTPFETESFRFYGTILGGQQQQKPRWQRVQRAASAEIGEIVAQLYVSETFGPAAKERALAMVADLFEAMGDAIRQLGWMSDETKQAALTKLEAFTVKIGYPDEWRDYSGLVLGDGPWATARRRARAFEYRRRLNQLDEPVDPDEWEMAAHEVNAYYHPLRTEIVFPAGILQPPYFDAEADDAVNYGAIGAVIGHEITHGFDDMGSRFDAAGNFADWWTEEDRDEFERRAGVIVDQFNGYEVLDGLHLNGDLSIGENIADLGGVTIAYAALQRALASTGRATVGGLTPEQRFFMAFARGWRSNQTDEYLRLRVQTDEHAPAEFRCNGPLSNLSEFMEAFHLEESAPMMRPPENRAKVW